MVEPYPLQLTAHSWASGLDCPTCNRISLGWAETVRLFRSRSHHHPSCISDSDSPIKRPPPFSIISRNIRLRSPPRQTRRYARSEAIPRYRLLHPTYRVSGYQGDLRCGTRTRSRTSINRDRCSADDLWLPNWYRRLWRLNRGP